MADLSFNPASLAYFSMEIGMDASIPTYAGGLGVLAGDTIKSAADISLPVVAITLLHRHGYFNQRLDEAGQQYETPMEWKVEEHLQPMEPLVSLQLEGRTVFIKAWRYMVKGVTGAEVPVMLLDTELPQNSETDRTLTDNLYGGDKYLRLCQEAVLGIGGVRMLRALGYDSIERFHLNEGHAALIILELAEEYKTARGIHGPPTIEIIDEIKKRCIFTTHTPVPAGHDQFPKELVAKVLGETCTDLMKVLKQDKTLNMTALAMSASRYMNGVAMKHGQVSRAMFPEYPIGAITNGVHAVTWAAPPLQALFDRHLPEWRYDSLMLRYAISIPNQEMWAAHMEAKQALVDIINSRTQSGFDRDVFTIGYARRATAYKRPTLLFHDPNKLKVMAKHVGPIQIVFAGKAHQRDEEGKALIRQIHETAKYLRGTIAVTYLQNYDMNLARVMVSGCDLWLNTPRAPLEASGTSGMKAAVNGVPSLSVLDGWWVEGHIEGVTGWAIGEAIEDTTSPVHDRRCANALYDKISKFILPRFYRERELYIEIMKKAIALNGGYFNTQRMLMQYIHRAYGLNNRRTS